MLFQTRHAKTQVFAETRQGFKSFYRKRKTLLLIVYNMENKLKKTKNKKQKTIRTFFILISPWIIGFCMFTLCPIVASLILGFTDAKVATITTKPLNFIGVWNYVHVITEDTIFLRSIGNTFYYAIVRVLVGTVLSVLLAVFFNREIKGKGIFRTMIYAPSLMPVVASALVFKILLVSDGNIAVSFLQNLGLGEVDFISEKNAMGTVIFIALINGIGPNMIVILAALQSVPKELEEAATMDGAGKTRVFFNIVLPFISSSLMFVTLTGFISALQVYASISLFTGGGPNYATITMGMQIVANAFALDSFGMGYACAQAWILFVIVLAFTMIYYRLMIKKVYFGD